MKYELITQYCGRLNPGKWLPEKQEGNGTLENPYIAPFVNYDETVMAFYKDFYSVYDTLPENQQDYMNILKANKIDMKPETIAKIDITDLDDYLIMNLFMAIIRQDRFCEGLMNEFIENGCFENWLEELKKKDK